MSQDINLLKVREFLFDDSDFFEAIKADVDVFYSSLKGGYYLWAEVSISDGHEVIDFDFSLDDEEDMKKFDIFIKKLTDILTKLQAAKQKAMKICEQKNKELQSNKEFQEEQKGEEGE